MIELLKYQYDSRSRANAQGTDNDQPDYLICIHRLPKMTSLILLIGDINHPHTSLMSEHQSIKNERPTIQASLSP
jgi:hypothetical protein